jgi:hypothetical protein
MLHHIPKPVRCLPLCSLLFLVAAEDDCTIRIETDDDDEEECPDRAELCPDLQCDVFATDDDGCTLCECAGNEGEGEGEGECNADSDCAPGLVCTFVEECACSGGQERPDGSGDQAPPDDPNQPCTCEVYGLCTLPSSGCAAVLCAPDTMCVEDENGNAQCVPVGDLYCQSDADCLNGERCNLDYCINPDCNNSPDGACEPVCVYGLCEGETPPGECWDDSSCPDGFHCEFYDPAQPAPDCDPNTNDCSGLVAPAGRCVENDPNQCEALCGPGSTCEISADGEVRCVPIDDCAALCGPGATCEIFDDGSVACVPVEPAQCASDVDCADGLVCNAAEVCMTDPACQDPNTDPACTDLCWGYCVEPAPTSCQADSDCAQGQICELRDSCAPCQDGTNNCFVPCVLEGVCVTP